MSILDWGPVSHVRRNHALEHATIKVLAEGYPGISMAGFSDSRGFWIVGNLSTEQVYEGVYQALARLEGGEYGLAIHPNCGTNFVAAGFLAGTLGWLGMIGTRRGLRDKLERWPLVVSLVTVGLMLAQPVGPYLQMHVTTAAVMNGLQVSKIERHQRGDVPMHWVLTRG